MISNFNTDLEKFRYLSNQICELEEKLKNTLSLEQFQIYHELQSCRFLIDAMECARISAVKQEMLNFAKAEYAKNQPCDNKADASEEETNC